MTHDEAAPTPKGDSSKHAEQVAADLATPAAELGEVAQARGLTLAQLALVLREQDAQTALRAMQDMFALAAELGVARTRAEAAAQLERLVREAQALEATPDQVRRLLIDVLKLAEQRPRRTSRTAEGEEEIAPMSDAEQAALRKALERAAEAPLNETP